MSKKIPSIASTVTLAVVLAVHAEDITPSIPSTSPTDTILAITNGVSITQSAYDRYLETRPSGASRERKAVIDEMINRALVLQDATKLGVDKKPETLAEIAMLRDNLLVAATLQSISEKMPLTDEEQHKFYTAHLPEMTVKEYKARHILLSSEEEAKGIIAELDKGNNFISIAKEKSKENAGEGGDLGWLSANQMVKPFADATLALEKGKYTTHPVQTEFGWHVILLEDTRETPPPAFDAIKDRIKSLMQRMKLQEYVHHLRTAATVEIKDPLYNPITK